MPYQCTTTVVSAGDAGVNNLAALRRYIVAQTRTRMYAFLHIANNGLSAFPVAELYNIDNAQVEACAMALSENPDFLIGVKVRMSENVIFKHGIEPLKRAIQAQIENPLAQQILRGEFTAGDRVGAKVKRDSLVFEKERLH